MVEDPIVPLDELIKKDNTFSLFSKINEDGSSSELTIEDLQKMISKVQLFPSVPSAVKKVFNGAKHLFIFGYFEYYFFTISVHYAFLALGSALRSRYSEIFGKPKSFIRLSKVIEKLVEAKIIPQSQKKMYAVGKDLRNSFSHLEDPPIDTPSPDMLERTAQLINELYKVKNA